MALTIYGASDDLIEVEGDIEDEVGAYNKGDVRFVVSDGTTGTIGYSRDGIWRIVIIEAGTLPHELVRATNADTDYSDRLTINGPVEWVQIGRRRLPNRRKTERRGA